MNELSVHAGATETPLPADFRWPGGKRLAVFFRCAFEGWSDGHWPGVGPMGNPLKPGVPDLNAIGFAEYGHRRGIFRVLETLGREGVKATMIVSGIMAERHAEIVRQISEAGHDIVAHSYAMDVIPIYLSEDEERANIRRTVDLIVRAPMTLLRRLPNCFLPGRLYQCFIAQAPCSCRRPYPNLPLLP